MHVGEYDMTDESKDMLSELTDKIDSELDELYVESSSGEVSVELIESLDTHDEDLSVVKAKNAMEVYLREQLAKNPLESFEALPQVNNEFDSRIISEIGVQGEEGFVYFTAFQYYEELVKRARRFNKQYAKFTDKKVNIWRTLKDPSKGQKYSKEFNPFVYHVSIESTKINPAVDLAKRELFSDAATASDAALRAAYHLGFLDSVEYKSAEKQFHPLAIERIKANAKYMAAVRRKDELSEHTAQIKHATYATPLNRQKWHEDLISATQAELEKLKGAV